MVLIRLFVLESLKQNVRVFAKFVRSQDNGLADALSQMDMPRFHRLGPFMDIEPTNLPHEIWPIWKIWVHFK